MDSSSFESQSSDMSKSKKSTLNNISSPMSKKAQKQDPNPWSSKTPDKPAAQRRTRNRGAIFSIVEVKKIAQGLRDSDPSVSGRVDKDSKMSSARKQILSWPSESSDSKSRNASSNSTKLPEKYEMLSDFFNSMDSAIRLLRMKGLTATFTKICPQIESLTDRRFSYGHLAQLKSILPEAIEIKKVNVMDECTNCMRPDLHVTLDANAIENDKKLKPDTATLHMRKVFRARLLEYIESHPKGAEIPEEELPEPFCRSKQGLQLNNHDASSSSLPVETSSCSPLDEKPAVASHLSQTFQRRFSRTVSSHGTEKTDSKLSEGSQQPSRLTIPKPCLNQCPSNEEAITCAAPSPIKFSSKPTSRDTRTAVKAEISKSQPFSTPSKEKVSSQSQTSPTDSPSMQGTPVKLTSTPAKLINVITPVLQTPKRSLMSPNDDSEKTPNKLVRRLSRIKSLKFNTPVKNEKVEELEVNEAGCSSFDSDLLDILDEKLFQSIKERERKAMEESDPAISQAKRRRDMIASLPKLFNTIHFYFNSINRSVVTKEEFVHSLIKSQFDILDRRELEEQLKLLQELVPEYISEKLAISGDLLLKINKATNTESIRARLTDAK